MIKILHYIPGFLCGGIESMFLEWYKHIDHQNIEFELLFRTHDDNSIALKKYRELNGTYYRLSSFSLKHINDFRKSVKVFFALHHDYDILHAHGSDPFVFSEAKKYGIKIILHSHSTQTANSLNANVRFLYEKLLKYFTVDYAFACSQKAAKWKFGRSNFKGKKVTIIHNAIDVKKYTYDEKKRVALRKKLNVENLFVIGHVARLTYAKNQFYLLDIFKSVLSIKTHAILLIIGDGPDEKELKKYALDLGILDKVFFLGNRADVSDLMQAMDIFLFPSRYEGLGIAVIEAQASGLHTICSTGVPNAAKITDLVQFIPLSSSPKEWANIICDTCIDNRMDTSSLIAKRGYDMETEIKRLIDKYIEIYDDV